MRDGAEQTRAPDPRDGDPRGRQTTAARRSSATNGDPQYVEVGFVGMGADGRATCRQPIWAGPAAAFENVGAVAGIIWQLPVRIYDTAVDLVTGQERDPNGPLSVVGAGVLAGEVAAADAPILNRVAGFLGLLASLNIALFVFNLIPLLPLDGGHVVVALWDGIKRAWAKLFRRPPPKPGRCHEARAGDVRRRGGPHRHGRRADPRRPVQPGVALLRTDVENGLARSLWG